MTRTTKRRPAPPPEMEETREHVMAAGRELLLAAGGALRFCQQYVETSVPPASRADLLAFFRKAIAVADELGRGIAGVSTITKAAGAVAKPLFTAMGQEMRAQQSAAKAPKPAAGRTPEETPCPRNTRRSSSATRTASSTTRRTRATSRSRTSAR